MARYIGGVLASFVSKDGERFTTSSNTTEWVTLHKTQNSVFTNNSAGNIICLIYVLHCILTVWN